MSGKPSDDAADADDGSESQQRIHSVEPSVGHIAGAVVAVLLIIAIVLVIVSVSPVCAKHLDFALYGLANGTMLCPSFVCLPVCNVCIVAKVASYWKTFCRSK